MNKTVIKILELEWECFQTVKNQGGRAPCQDDLQTFIRMRASQFMAWSQELLDSYLHDLEVAISGGGNLIAEKYARMMQFTDIKGYDAIQHLLPVISPEKENIINEIVLLQLPWQNEYAAKYPILASSSRAIMQQDDKEEDTSFETYLRGELYTYSLPTLKLYKNYLFSLKEKGENITLKSMEYTAKMYGYTSVEELEKIQAKNR